jgi:S1-C subfamily serine protease
LADNDPQIGDNCIAVGNPLSSRNKITVGNGESYESIELTDSKLISDVTFNVFKHSANVKGGSSGGALLNEDLELIGINYAGKIFFVVFPIDSFALPISNVKEFISLYDPA